MKNFLIGVLAVSLYQQTAFANPSIQIKSAVFSSKKAGQSVSVGDQIQTSKGGVVSADFVWGGIKSISILPSSLLKFDIFGNRANGGRFSQFSVVGEALIEVKTSNPQSEVKVCLKNHWGRTACASLKSTVRTAPIQSGEQVLGVIEGDVLVKGGVGAPVRVGTNQYTLLKKDGTLSAPTSVVRMKGYSDAIGRSKAIGVFQADPGWRFCDGSTMTTAAIGTRLCVIDPLRGFK
jgi:hypothetical protein